MVVAEVVIRGRWSLYCPDEDQWCRLQDSTRVEEENEDCSLRPSHGVQRWHCRSFLIGTIRTKEGAMLRNKPIRRPGTTPMGRLVCSITHRPGNAAFVKGKPGSGCRDGPRKPSKHRQERIGLNRGHRRERLLFSQLSQESPVKLRRNYFIHNRCGSRVNSSY